MRLCESAKAHASLHTVANVIKSFPPTNAVFGNRVQLAGCESFGDERFPHADAAGWSSSTTDRYCGSAVHPDMQLPYALAMLHTLHDDVCMPYDFMASLAVGICCILSSCTECGQDALQSTGSCRDHGCDSSQLQPHDESRTSDKLLRSAVAAGVLVELLPEAAPAGFFPTSISLWLTQGGKLATEGATEGGAGRMAMGACCCCCCGSATGVGLGRAS